MILVDIFVPSVDRKYNFSLNEGIDVSSIIKEVVEMIAQKEQTRLSGDLDKMLLYNMGDETPLNSHATLVDCGITTGNTLMLV